MYPSQTGAVKIKVSCRLRIEQRILQPSTNENFKALAANLFIL